MTRLLQAVRVGAAAISLATLIVASSGEPTWRVGGVYSVDGGMVDGTFFLTKVVSLDRGGCALFYEGEHHGRPTTADARGLQAGIVPMSELLDANLDLWQPHLVALEDVTPEEAARCDGGLSEKAALLRAALLSGCRDGGALPGVEVDDRGQPLSIPDDFELGLEWTPPCLGTPPLYSVAIRADGSVVYRGTKHVATVGEARETVGLNVVRSLLAAACHARLLDRPDAYGPRDCPQYWTDMPQSIITLRVNGHSKRIAHDHGCQGLAELAELTALEELIDDLADSERWVRGPKR